MKLLLDQNLSRRNVTQLSQAYPETTQVSLLDMAESTDKEIWDYAQLHGYAIVTLDADFHEYSLLWDGPPLVVWLRYGNQPSNVVLQKLLQSQPAIEQAHGDVDIWCIEVLDLEIHSAWILDREDVERKVITQFEGNDVQYYLDSSTDVRKIFWRKEYDERVDDVSQDLFGKSPPEDMFLSLIARYMQNFKQI